MDKQQTRRTILVNAAKTTVGLVAAATIGPLILQGCKRDNNESLPTDAQVELIPCPDQDALSDQDRSIRNSLRYVDATPLQGRTCDNCKLYTWPMPSKPCGGCRVVPGPIHPKGYCTAWIHRM